MINCWNLESKAKLVVEEIPYLRSAAIGVYIRVGSRNENAKIAGASHFIEHMLFKGTEKRSAREIAESFEAIGGQLNAFTSKEYTCVYARTLDENIYMAIDILFDMLFNSQFLLRDVSTEKGVVIEEINMYEDTPDDLIHDVFARSLWEGHPMGSPILGTLESVSNFSPEEIYDFYKSRYVPANMVISVAGNVDGSRIKDVIDKYLEKQKKEESEWSNSRPSGNKSFIKLVEKDTEQIQICLGVPGISFHDQRRYTQNVMNSILGGGMSSRLFQTIREENGLAYSIYSYPSNYSDTGSYSIHIGTGPAKISKFFEVLYKELNSFVSEGVNKEEVSRTQQLIKSSIYMSLESVMNRMSRMGKSLLMYDKVKPIEEVIDRVLAIDPEMVMEFSSDILKNEIISLAAIGSSEVLPVVEEEYKKWWS